MNGFRLDRLQPLGRALMLPIAVLPVAGLLLRLGQPDLLDIAFLSAAGDAIFSNLGLLFAIGVVKSRWTRQAWLVSGLEILALGAFAGIAGFFFGNLLPTLLGVPAATP